jgi:hypothetical protein
VRSIVIIGLAASVAACADPAPPSAVSGVNAVSANGLVALVGTSDDVRLLGWGTNADDPIPIELPRRDAGWIATGRADVLAATLTDGSVATSNPVRLGGRPITWRPVRAAGPNGDEPTGPEYFATWDPEGGRYATLAGDLAGGDSIRVVLVDPTVASAFEIALDQPVVPAPPTWIDDDRLVVITGDTDHPSATIVDATTGRLAEGPEGSRLLAASADGHRIATMAGRGAPVVVRDTSGWLAGDGSSLASIEPPDAGSSAIAIALDDDGERLAIAWAAADGSVSLAVHGGASDWRRVAAPSIGSAQGAVVAWRRGG